MSQFTVLSSWSISSSSRFKVVAVIVLVLGLFLKSEGLRMCYNCDTRTSGLGCVYSPNNVTDGEISCKGFCTIRRTEYASLPEDAFPLISLQRRCEKSPVLFDSVVMEGYYKIYYRSCKSYLCNVGDGIKSLRDIPIDPAWDYYQDEEEVNNKGTFPKSAFSLTIILCLIKLLI